jgi:ankyrin repeat protein
MQKSEPFGTIIFMSELLNAVEQFDKERVRRLLESGADPNIRGFAGVTPLHLAVDIEVEDAIRRYDSGGVETPPDGALVRLLVAHGTDVEAKDDKGETPLDWAKQRKHQAAIKVMAR